MGWLERIRRQPKRQQPVVSGQSHRPQETVLGYYRSPAGEISPIKAGRSGHSAGMYSGYDPSLVDYLRRAPRELRGDTLGLALAYFASEYALRCIEIRANRIAGTPWYLYDKRTRDRLPKENSLQVAFEWAQRHYQQNILYLWGRSRTMYGETFVEPCHDLLGRVGGLRWLNNLGMQIYERTGTGTIDFFEYQDGNGGVTRWNYGEILYERRYNPLNDLRGASPLMAGLDAINVSRATQHFVLSWFNNGAQPGIIFSPKEGVMVSVDADRMRQTLKDDLQGVENWFEPLVMPKPMDVTVVEMPPLDEQQFLRDDVRDQICNAIGVPRGLVDHNNAKYQLSPEQRRAFIENEIVPELEQIGSVIDSQLMPMLGEHAGFAFDIDTLLDNLVDPAYKVQVARDKFQSGAISFHEFREQLGEAKPPGEDWFILPSGYVAIPATAIGNAPALTKPVPPPSPFGFGQSPGLMTVQDDPEAELKSWLRYSKKYGARRAATKFETRAIDDDLDALIREQLLGVTPDDDRTQISAIFAGARNKAVDAPAAFLEYWQEYDALMGSIGATWVDEYMQGLAEALLSSDDITPERLQILMDDQQTGLMEAWIGTEDNPGPMLQLALAGAAAGQAALERNRPADPQQPVKATLRVDWKLLAEEALAFIRNYLPTLIRRIDQTTMERVRAAIEQWIISGQPLDTLRDTLTPMFNDSRRAELIAQTETTRVYNEGAYTRWQNAGVTQGRWITVKDNLVCPTCVALDGQIANLSQGWVLNGTLYRAPAHPGCRCFARPVVD